MTSQQDYIHKSLNAIVALPSLELSQAFNQRFEDARYGKASKVGFNYYLYVKGDK